MSLYIVGGRGVVLSWFVELALWIGLIWRCFAELGSGWLRCELVGLDFAEAGEPGLTCFGWVLLAGLIF